MDSPNQYPCHAESEMIQAPLGSLALSHSIAALSSRSETSRSTQYPTRRRSSSLEREWNFPTPSSLRRARWSGSIFRLKALAVLQPCGIKVEGPVEPAITNAVRIALDIQARVCVDGRYPPNAGKDGKQSQHGVVMGYASRWMLTA